MERLESRLIDGEGSKAEKRKSIMEKFDAFMDRNGRSVILMAALGIAAQGIGVEHPAFRNEGGAAQQEAVLDISTVGGQKAYERALSLDSKLADHLRQEIGVDNVDSIEYLNSIADQEERSSYIAEHTENPVRVSRFEGLAKYGGPSNKEVKEVIDLLPLTFRIDAAPVRYENKEIPLPERYGIKGERKGAPMLEAAHADDEANEIVFSAGSKGGDYLFTLSSVVHEEAHLKDWSTNRALTIAERMKLIQEVIDRVNSRDRYKSSYIESIKNSDKQAELYAKSTEYYAEITRAYFDNDYFLLPRKDQQIIKQLIHETDPAFTAKDRDRVEEKINELTLRHEPSEWRDPDTGKIINSQDMQ